MLIILLATLLTGVGFTADLHLHGQIIDENNTPVADARITVVPRASEPGERIRLQTQSSPTGRFSLPVPGVPDYFIQVEREGHFLVRQQITLDQAAADLAIVLPHQTRSSQSVDVIYSGSGVDVERTHSHTLVTADELLDVPYPRTNEIRNALRILPGAVNDSRGGIHLNGGSENQVLYTLDGFTINDPLTGTLEARLSVEGIRAFELRSGSLPAEYGKGAAGALSIRTEPGTDQRRFSATNFVPGFEHQKNWIIGGWTPRFGFSGPLRKGRAWLSNSSDIQLSNTVVREAPPGEDSSTSWRAGNMLRAQVNLSNANILSAGLLTNYLRASKTGLTALDPVETTADRRARSNFLHLKEQIASRGGGLAEFGYAAFRSFGREIPQGCAPQVFTPYGRRGNYLLDAQRKASRDEIIANVFLPGIAKFGRHRIKMGFDGDLVAYEQDVRRNGFEFRRANGTLIRQTRFGGNSAFRTRSRELSAYVQDSWRPISSLMLEFGLRQDRDSLVGRATIGPRVGVAQAIGGATKIAAGYATVFEAANLRMFSEALDQYSISTSYLSGDVPQQLVTVTNYRANAANIRSPKYTIWNASVEHEFFRGLYARSGYLRRRGSTGFAFLPSLAADKPFEFQMQSEVYVVTQELTNLRTDLYDSFELLVRHSFRKQYEWMAAYTRSRALSNSVTDVRLDNATVALNNAGRMAWDSPNRLISWGYVPTWSKSWAIAYMLEYRTGHPFSVFDEYGTSVGEVNSYRYPDFLELNAHIERQFAAMGHRWAFRFGFNNLTNHQNPNVVMNTIGVPNFMKFYGGQGRAFNVRMRWLGKAL